MTIHSRKAPHEEIRIFRPTDLPGTEIWSVKNSPRCPTILHEMYTLCSVSQAINSISRWQYRHRQYQSGKGHLMLMEPGEIHATRNITGLGTYRVLRLSPAYMEGVSKQFGLKNRTPHIKTPSLNAHPLFIAAERFHDSVKDKNATLLERETRLAHCIDLLMNHCVEDSPPDIRKETPNKRLHRVRDYIHDHFDENISLTDLSLVAGLSRFHLLRRFKAIFGAPPHAFQKHLRLARARELLAQGIPPAEIDVGFADQSHLTRFFNRAHMGITPALYGTPRDSSR